MVSELMDTTMYSVLREGIPLVHKRRAVMPPILSGAVRGMQLLHEKNLVHGDIKPDNILVNFNIEGQVVSVKLGDFGLSRFLMDGMKTPNGNQYFGFAPEDDLTVKYDIFSFGVV